MEATPHELRIFSTISGREPFSDWQKRLVPEHRARIRVALKKFQNGNVGNVKSVGDGVAELRIDFGPGYRVYLGQSGTEAHLICGGDKSTQAADIAYAKKLWSTR